MRILVIDEEIPFPLNSGKRLRTFNLLKYLASRHEIVFLCRQHEGEEKPEKQPLENLGIRIVVVRDPIRKKAGTIFYLSLLANLLAKYPYVVRSHLSNALIDTIEALLQENSFDVFHCEWTPYAVNLKPFLPGPSVIMAHNVESVIWRRYFETEANVLKKSYIFFQWKKMEKFEREVFPLFSVAVSVSEKEKSIISQWIPEDRISVVANGVDTEYFAASRAPRKAHSLVFSGAMDWRPNVDCMIYFLDEVWPLVLGSFPDSSLTIVGRNPMPALENRVAGISSVALTGTVEDVRPYIQGSSVYIVPLRVGGGSRLKILEALSMGMAVVSTTVGAEGLEVIGGRHLLIADSPVDFAAAIGRLFKNPKLCEKLGFNGTSLVKERYQWSSLAMQLEEVWWRASTQIIRW